MRIGGLARNLAKGLACSLLLVSAYPSAWGAESIRLVVATSGELHPEKASVHLAQGTVEVEREVALVDGRGKLLVELQGSGALTAEATASGFWCPKLKLTEPPQEPVELVLWPAAEVEGRVLTADEDYAPDAVRLTLKQVPVLPTGSPEQPEEAEVECAIDDHKVSGGCTVPAGRWHLRIKATGFVTVHRWNLAVDRGKTVDLGGITLQRGASVFGRVVTGDGAPLSAKAVVELRPMVTRGVIGSELAEELKALAEEVEVNEWGYFQLEAVSPRTYQLTARDTGYAPTVLRPLPIHAREQLELREPITLEPALILRVIVSPPQGPDGQSMTIGAFDGAVLSAGETVARGPTRDGEWESPPLPAGPYLIQVSDQGGRQLAFQEFELSRAETTLRVELEYVPISGKVVSDDEPLSAALTFNAEGSHEGPTVESDDEGRFELVLPRPGKWLVDVRDEEDGIDCRRIEVEPEQSDEVVIEVPATRIAGEVCHTDLTAAAGARVELIATLGERKASIYQDRTDGEGHFELKGVRPGTYRVEASKGRLHSGIAVVEVAESQPTPPITLVLCDSWVVKGKVVSAAGPVPAASIWPLPFTGQGAWAVTGVEQITSEIDGSFAVPVPDSTGMVLLITMAPGFALNAHPVPRPEEGSPEEDLLVRLAPPGGTLQLAWPSQQGVVIVNGVPMPQSLLTQWAFLNGSPPHRPQPLVVPAMPAGEYWYCDLTFDEANAVTTGRAVPTVDRCSRGFLREGDSLTLSAPPR